MIVMKFGGTSVANATRIRSAARLILEHRDAQPVVVVSALAGTTNTLAAIIRLAIARENAQVQSELDRIHAAHLDVVRELELQADRELLDGIEAEVGRLRELAQGILLLGECPARVRDSILSSGELLSHLLVASAVNGEGGAAQAVDPRLILCTDSQFGEANADRERTREQATARLRPLIERGVIPVTGGFVGATESGETTTLGRGGSDLSATLLALALDADEVQIWTDVDGMMTADPRVVATARTLPELSFREACELAYFGARVLHPATILPAIERQIPVRVLNSMRPNVPGTLIAEAPLIATPAPGTVRAVAWKTEISLVSLTSGRMLGAYGFLARAFEIFARHETPVDVVTTSEVSISLTVDRSDRLGQIAQDLGLIGTVEVTRGVAVVCVVGCGFLDHPELLGQVLLTLEGIPLRMFCLGSSDVNLTLVVEQGYAEEVVQRLHARFLEGAPSAAPIMQDLTEERVL